MSETQNRGQQPKKERTDPLIKPKNTKSVVTYLVVLFIAAFILLGLAYLMQQRDDHASRPAEPQTACIAVHNGCHYHH